jgi:hypothetical protein
MAAARGESDLILEAWDGGTGLVMCACECASSANQVPGRESGDPGVGI